LLVIAMASGGCPRSKSKADAAGAGESGRIECNVNPDDDGSACTGDWWCVDESVCCPSTGQCCEEYGCGCENGVVSCWIDHWCLFDGPCPPVDLSEEPDEVVEIQVEVPFDIPVDLEPEPEFGKPCETTEDCAEWMYCLETKTIGNVCVHMHCMPECPEGWDCFGFVFPGSPDPNFICKPYSDCVCEPCEKDLHCSGAGNLCVQLDDGTFCGYACPEDDACADGYDCRSAPSIYGGEVDQCVPVSGSCGG